MSAIQKYIDEGRLPWTHGYSKFKNEFISTTLKDRTLMQLFRDGARLPDNYGDRLDERVVEYPWVLARLDTSGIILDAGSTFSSPTLLDSPQIEGRRLIIYTMMTDWITLNANISYIFSDFREMILKDDCITSIACISTLEHVGLSYDYKTYNIENHWPDQDVFAYRETLRQFHRILKPGGQFLLTMPYGRYENHGWLQQHDAASLKGVIDAWPGRLSDEAYFHYCSGGWQVASAAECADSSYWNIHHTPAYDPDHAAAARAVSCLEFIK